MIRSSFRFEWNKFRFDNKRKIVFYTGSLFIILLSLMICFLTIKPLSKQDIMLDETFINSIEQQLELGFLSPNRIKYYHYLLDTRPGNWISNPFSNTGSLLPNNNYVNESTVSFWRMAQYLSIIYICLPIYMVVSLYHTLIEDKVNDFERHYNIYGIDYNDLYPGKLLFSLTTYVCLFIVFVLLGLIFYNDIPIIIFNDDTLIITSSIRWYFEKSLFMFIDHISMFFIISVILRFIKNKILYESLMFFLILAAFIPMLSAYGSDGFSRWYITNASNIPYWSFSVNLGFSSFGPWFNLGTSLIVTCISIIYLYLNYTHKKKRIEKNKYITSLL